MAAICVIINKKKQKKKLQKLELIEKMRHVFGAEKHM